MPETKRSTQELIKAKYSRPKPGPSLVSRRRISENLDRALGHGLTVVTAPAGNGSPLIWILIAIGVVGLGVCAVYLIRSRKRVHR